MEYTPEVGKASDMTTALLPMEEEADDSADNSGLQLATTRTFDEVAHLAEQEETPIGRHIGSFGVVMMVVQRIVGSGIFSVSGSIYNNVGGSPFLFFVVWLISGYMAFAGMFCFLEVGSIVPRGGGMKVFLEYIYYKPRMMMTVVFSLYSIIFGFVITNAIIFGKYLLYAFGVTDFSNQTAKNVGFAFVVATCVVTGLSSKLAMASQNVIGVIKLALLGLMALSGLMVLILPESVTHITNNLHLSSFFVAKRPVTLESFVSALLKGFFSFGGWQTVHVVTNEIENPVETMNYAAPLAIGILNVAYFLINLSYLIVIPDKELTGLQEMVGGILFEKIFGYQVGSHILSASVAISAAGNIIVSLYHISRMNQEIFRDGFLPFSKYFSSNEPFGTPMRCLIFPLVLSAIFMLLPTPENVYNYVVVLEGYPVQLFIGLTCFGIFILRRRNGGQSAFKARTMDIIFVTIFSVLTLVGPLNPFSKSKEFVGFPNYAYLSVFILFLAWLYWYMMFRVLPHFGHYDLKKARVILSDGLTITEWEKTPLDDSIEV